jgi:hypothetical protein
MSGYVIASTVLFSIALVWSIITIALCLVKDKTYGMFFIPIIFILGAATAVLFPSPKYSDLENGKAQYITNVHSKLNEQGDTISSYKTYKLVWKDEWKYGRKQH